MTLTTTFRSLREHDACVERYEHLRKALPRGEYGDDTPISLLTILDVNGVEDALWALRACGDGAIPIARELTIRCAEHVEHIGAPEVAACNRVTRRYLRGQATREELMAAWAAEAAARAEAEAAWWFPPINET